MNRVWDYIGFVIWFMGLGYVALWLLGSHEHAMLTPPLHAVGLLSAIFVLFRLLTLAIARRRRPAPIVLAAARMPAAPVNTPRAKPAHARPPVKPRSHFGLRGTPE